MPPTYAQGEQNAGWRAGGWGRRGNRIDRQWLSGLIGDLYQGKAAGGRTAEHRCGQIGAIDVGGLGHRRTGKRSPRHTWPIMRKPARLEVPCPNLTMWEGCANRCGRRAGGRAMRPVHRSSYALHAWLVCAMCMADLCGGRMARTSTARPPVPARARHAPGHGTRRRPRPRPRPAQPTGSPHRGRGSYHPTRSPRAPGRVPSAPSAP